jgi:hypothetical protein
VWNGGGILLSNRYCLNHGDHSVIAINVNAYPEGQMVPTEWLGARHISIDGGT